MTTKFNMTKDVAGYNGFGLEPSDVKYGVILAAGEAQSITLPEDQPWYIALFSQGAGVDIYVAYDTTAAVYSGTMGAVNSELNPSARKLRGGTEISLITDIADGAKVEIAVYVAPPYTN